jgi:8-oxo-dGTP pyrophosphatase MutT (NUDIX family)
MNALHLGAGVLVHDGKVRGGSHHHYDHRHNDDDDHHHPSSSSPSCPPTPNQGNIFVHQRTSTKRLYPSLHDMLIGGVCHWGESTENAAKRELREELGLGAGRMEYVLRCLVTTEMNR